MNADEQAAVARTVLELLTEFGVSAEHGSRQEVATALTHVISRAVDHACEDACATARSEIYRATRAHAALFAAVRAHAEEIDEYLTSVRRHRLSLWWRRTHGRYPYLDRLHLRATLSRSGGASGAKEVYQSAYPVSGPAGHLP